jgi:hypothetical protein
MIAQTAELVKIDLQGVFVIGFFVSIDNVYSMCRRSFSDMNGSVAGEDLTEYNQNAVQMMPMAPKT